MDKVRAKFQVQGVKKVSWNEDVMVVELCAVTANDIPENERFHRYTPSGRVEMTIDNPAAAKFFQVGRRVYVDFTAAP